MAALEVHKDNIMMALRMARDDGYVVVVDASDGSVTLEASKWRYDMYNDERSELLPGIEVIEV